MARKPARKPAPIAETLKTIQDTRDQRIRDMYRRMSIPFAQREDRIRHTASMLGISAEEVARAIPPEDGK